MILNTSGIILQSVPLCPFDKSPTSDFSFGYREGASLYASSASALACLDEFTTFDGLGWLLLCEVATYASPSLTQTFLGEEAAVKSAT